MTLKEADKFVNKRWDDALEFYGVDHVYKLPLKIYLEVCADIADHFANNLGTNDSAWPKEIIAKYFYGIMPHYKGPRTTAYDNCFYI